MKDESLRLSFLKTLDILLMMSSFFFNIGHFGQGKKAPLVIIFVAAGKFSSNLISV
jgi:hypothetical protein